MRQLVLIFSLLFSFSIFSKTLNKVTMSDTIKINGKDLVLNGMGTRKATWLRVKVYVGGLYLAKKSNDAKEVINMAGPKYINMTFVRDVDGEKLKGGWSEGFEAAVAEGQRKTLQSKFDQFNNTMEDIEKGQSILITFSKEGVKVNVKNKDKGLIPGEDFARALLSIWFINARDEGLRDGMLGK